jgi:archaemetzincin
VKHKTILILSLFLIFYSCKNKISKSPIVIIIPYTDLDTSIINTTFATLKTQLPHILLYKAIPLPTHAFYSPRNRYRADTLLEYEGKLFGKDTVVIGMTSKDISTTKNKVDDWGVMGLGFSPGNACVVSSFRLTPKNKVSQFYKVAIHELGHTQGLPHCPNLSCFMRDAEGGNPLEEETKFCENCKKYLMKKGWTLK